MQTSFSLDSPREHLKKYIQPIKNRTWKSERITFDRTLVVRMKYTNHMKLTLNCSRLTFES